METPWVYRPELHSNSWEALCEDCKEVTTHLCGMCIPCDQRRAPATNNKPATEEAAAEEEKS
jgi:hypothetical protein